LARHALRHEGLAGAHGTAEEVAHGQALQGASLEQPGVLFETSLGPFVADDGVQPPARLDELEEALALSLDEALLQLTEDFGIQAPPAFYRRLHEHVDVGKRAPRRELGELGQVEVRELLDVPARHGETEEALAFGLVRQ